MTDQHNENIPALGNQIGDDILDIEENLEFHKDSFERIFETWSITDNSSAKFDSATGFTDGTYNYEFPTNPSIAASSVIMLGNSSTVAWFYLNAAPPGWLALSTGADTVLGVSGGSGDFNVNGGNADSSATWTIPTHNHQWWQHNAAATHETYIADGTETTITTDNAATTGLATAGSGTTKINIDGYTAKVSAADDTWRPSASVGKLFQLDTAA